MIARLHGVRSVRWLVLPWLALVYAWGRFTGSATAHDIPLLGPLPVAAGLQADQLFTVLLLLHAALYGVSLVVTLRGRGLIAYVGAQGLLVLSMGATFSNEYGRHLLQLEPRAGAGFGPFD